jgi:hypothetical protein
VTLLFLIIMCKCLNFFLFDGIFSFNLYYVLFIILFGFFKILFSKNFFKKSNWFFLKLFIMDQNQKNTFNNILLNTTNSTKNVLFFYNNIIIVLKNFYNKVSLIMCKLYIWRPLVKKTSYFGLYANSRINFTKFFN